MTLLTMRPTPTLSERARAESDRARALFRSLLHEPVWSVREAAHAAAVVLSEGVEIVAYWDDDEDDAPWYEVTAEGVAVIPITGVLLDCEPTWWMNYMGASSIPQIGRMAQAAWEDSNVRAIALYTDSPGGHASGLAPVADILFAIREDGTKPLVALCKEACSAAYHLASQCGRIVASADAPMGCIGTLILARDYSKMYAENGISVERITSDGGEEFKGAGAIGTELTPAMKADWKRIANESQALFTEHVARGLEIELSAAAKLADGRYHIGQNAVALGLADNVMSLEEALLLLETGEEWPDTASPATVPDDTDDDTDQSRRDPAHNSVVTDPANPRTGKEKTMERTFSFLRGGKKDLAPAPTAEKTEEQNKNTDPPAQITEAELSALRQENDRLKADNERLTAFRSNVVTQFRQAAEASAVRAFGQNTDGLARAQRSIAAVAESDPLHLVELAEDWERQTPGSYKPTAQTTSQDVKGREEQAEDDKEFYANLAADTEKRTHKPGAAR